MNVCHNPAMLWLLNKIKNEPATGHMGDTQLKVYHAKNTRSLRIVWLLEELGVPYDLQALEFGPALQSSDYVAINPLAQVPSVIDGDLVLHESGAITQYILAKYGNGRLEPAKDAPEYGQYLQWLHFAEAGFMPYLGAIAQHAFIRPEDRRIPMVLAESQEKSIKIIGIIDKALAGRTYIAGNEFTAADTMLGYDLLLGRMFGLWNAETAPNVAAWFERLESRPAFQRAAA